VGSAGNGGSAADCNGYDEYAHCSKTVAVAVAPAAAAAVTLAWKAVASLLLATLRAVSACTASS
jgi:hypothetical protein